MLKAPTSSKRPRVRWRYASSVAALLLFGGMALGAAGEVWTRDDDALSSFGPIKQRSWPALSQNGAQNGSQDGTKAGKQNGSAALNPKKRWYRNAPQKDKGDDAPAFDENAKKVEFDPCLTATGETYVGPGTVLNPYAKESPCLAKRRAKAPSTPINFPLEQDDTFSLPAPKPGAGEGPAYTKEDFLLDLAVLWPPTGPVWGGGRGTGGGQRTVPSDPPAAPEDPIVSIDPPGPSDPITPDDPRDPDEPTNDPQDPVIPIDPIIPVVIGDDPPVTTVDPGMGGDPVPTPLPGGVVLFLTGGAVMAAMRKKRRA
mgnify:CR=1 FL=1